MRQFHLRAGLAALALLLASCGGGGGGGAASVPVVPPVAVTPPVDDGTVVDPIVYSTQANASLATFNELASVVRASMTLDGQALNYTATTGHLRAADARTGRAASFFYVAYTKDGEDKARRPVTFLFNGGPGSASMWLHMGSFGPKRIVTNNPSTNVPNPVQLVDNQESLLGVSDLVFVDAVGTGLSQAISPARNSDYWGVDSDAAGFRDFIQRYLEANARPASPLFIYGESYGGPRAAVLANLLETAGARVAGVLLQAPILDYNANCGVQDNVSCAGYIPTYAAVGAYHQRSSTLPTDFSSYIERARAYAAGEYNTAAMAFITNRTPMPDTVMQQLRDYTGIPVDVLRLTSNVRPGTIQDRILPGALVGRYDARVSAPNGSALTVDHDPSLTAVSSSFSSTIGTYIPSTLKYRAGSAYVSFNSIIDRWDFSHGGRALPDTVPDLAAALLLNPSMKIMSMSGYYDLATPFYLTEIDLARLAKPQNVVIKNYHGGHMSYFDDSARRLQRADLINFYSSATGGR